MSPMIMFLAYPDSIFPSIYGLILAFLFTVRYVMALSPLAYPDLPIEQDTLYRSFLSYGQRD